MKTMYVNRRNKLYVIRQDEDGKPYMFLHDDRHVYVNNYQEICCIKCLAGVKFLYENSIRERCYCDECKKYRGSFENFGFVKEIGV